MFEWPFSIKLGTSYHAPASLYRLKICLTPAVFALSKIWTGLLNKTTVVNREILEDRLERRIERKSPLLTISNHQSCLDDPVIWPTVLKWRYVRQHMRWIPAASEICFFNSLISTLCGSGQCVPVERGKGVYQRGMDFLVERLSENEWLHIFPEGKINLDNSKRLKWGIGRLIADCHTVPEVIPLWLIGMDSILPNSKPYLPRFGKNVTVYIGEPLNIRDKVLELKSSLSDARQLRLGITEIIEAEFWKVKELAEKYHQEFQLRNTTRSSS